MQDNNKSIIEKKWERLIKLITRFKFVPFVDFVLVSGSMAMGSAHEGSDFDLIVGAENGRIFTVRLFSSGIFELDKSRTNNDINTNDRSRAKDKICLNHFVTSDGYRLDPPHNKYWEDLYRNLVPVYGNKNKIEEFFKENSWVDDIKIRYDRWVGDNKSFLRKVLEFLFKGFIGNLLERFWKKYQIQRIEQNLEHNLGYKPQLRYDDTEMRFHVDTKRIEKYLEEEQD